METAAFRQVCVWLDEAAPGAGAFVHALEWAVRMGLPLQGIAAPEGPAGREADAVLEHCAAACLRRGVAWSGQRPPQKAQALEAFFRPDGLAVFGHDLPAARKGELLRQALRRPAVAALVCPPSWEPPARVLILDESRPASSRFLNAVAPLCQAFRAEPVVLTTAQSEGEAQRRQEAARQTLAAHRLTADYDFAVGCDLRTAVLQAARWRRCTHVFVAKRAAPWWRLLFGDPLAGLLGRSEGLAFLALPERTAPAPAPCVLLPEAAAR